MIIKKITNSRWLPRFFYSVLVMLTVSLTASAAFAQSSYVETASKAERLGIVGILVFINLCLVGLLFMLVKMIIGKGVEMMEKNIVASEKQAKSLDELRKNCELKK